MRATRLVSLLLLLQTRGQLTAANIAERLEVSVRTVHRDVESLAAAGVPVEAVRGPAGGYRLAGGYRTRLTGLTADEAEALFAAGMTGPAAELGLGGELAAARLKVLAALPSELQERATRAQRLFHLDARGWFRAEDSVPHLPSLAALVWRGCRARIRYREGARVVQRTIDPLGLVLKAGAWYLVAHRVAGMRVYRVSRIVSVRPLEDACERPDGFELAGYWQEWSRNFEQSLPRVDVLVRGLKGERTLTFQSLDEAQRELLRYGPDLEVIAPVELRGRIAEAAREVAALYVA
jgi:predicted DNA-binding transcriptional regulator YafY